MCDCMNQIKAIIGTHRLCRTKAFRIRVPVGFRSNWVIPTVELAGTYEAKIEDIEVEASSEEIPSDTEHQTDTDPETDQGEEYEHDESEVNEDELRETERQEQSLREQIAKLELDKMRTKRIRKKKE